MERENQDTNKSYNRKLTARMGFPPKSQLSKQTHPSQWKHMENWAAKEKASSQEKKRNAQKKEKEPVYPALELGKDYYLSVVSKYWSQQKVSLCFYDWCTCTWGVFFSWLKYQGILKPILSSKLDFNQIVRVMYSNKLIIQQQLKVRSQIFLFKKNRNDITLI